MESGGGNVRMKTGLGTLGDLISEEDEGILKTRTGIREDDTNPVFMKF